MKFSKLLPLMFAMAFLPATLSQVQAQTLSVSPAVTLSVQGIDYDRNYVEATGGGGINVTINPQGTTVSLAVESAGGTLADADVQVRSSSAGSTLTQYAALTATQNVWQGGGATARQINVDVRVRNIRSYGIHSAPTKSLLFILSPAVG